MTKSEFTNTLKDRLCDLPWKELESRINFYSEMIDDRIEEGLSEEDAVAAVGTVDEIVDQILFESQPVKTPKTDRRKLRVWEIILIILGSPVWLSLLIAVIAVAVALYAVLWSAIISLWSVFGAIIGGIIGGITAGILFIVRGNVYAGVAMIGASLVCTGLSIFVFFGGKYATNGVVLLTRKMFSLIKSSFSKKEER